MKQEDEPWESKSVPKMVGVIHFDGGCWPNPGGKARYAWTLDYHEVGDDRNPTPVARGSGEVKDGKVKTNNVAEYGGLRAALQWVGRLEGYILDRLIIRGDSQIVINCVQHERAHATKPHLAVLHRQCRELLDALAEKGWFVELEWIPREQNAEADALAGAV